MNAESKLIETSAAGPDLPIRETRQQRSSEVSRLIVYAGQGIFDMAAIVAGFFLAGFVRFGLSFSLSPMAIGAVVLAIFVGVAFNNGAYSREAMERTSVGIQRALWSLIFAMAVTALAVLFLKVDDEVSRVVFGLGAVFSTLLLIGGRLLFDDVAKAPLGWRPIDQLLIVDGAPAPEAVDMPVIYADKHLLRPNASDPLMLDRLGRALRGRDRVIVACRSEHRGDWALIMKGANINGYVLAPELAEIGIIRVARLGNVPLLRISTGPLSLRSRILKRSLDLVGAVLALALFLPLFIMTAIAIKLDSAGPVFFRQERVGRGNRLFLIYKFRSMRVDQCDAAGNLSTRRDDDRITRVGRFIRATSIDEIPQLLNVLLGDMSFVGPRPHALGSLAGDQLFWEVDRRYWDRHATKPGITGLAQVRGFRGATQEPADLANRLQADLEYLADWSIWRDLAILLRTLKVLVHRNAF